MKNPLKKLLDVFVRYVVLLAVAFPNLWIFYFIFTPLTVYPLYFLFGLFFDVSLTGNIIFVSNCFPVELIDACIAGSAYYLLLILNLATPSLKFNKRIKMIALSFAALLIINILRIFFLSLLFFSGSSLFDVAHKIFWYLGSIIFVVGIWFAEVKFFKIKQIPFYSDIKFFLKLKKKLNKTQGSKKNK